MTRGFSLVELLVALLLFQVGLLATAGMILTSQEIMTRSHLVLRGVVELGRVADSLMGVDGAETGSLARPWGEVEWAPTGQGPGGLVLVALSPAGDTLAVVHSWTHGPDTLPWQPGEAASPSGGGGKP